MNSKGMFTVALLISMHRVAHADLESLLSKGPTSAVLESQLQVAAVEQQNYANRLIRGGVHQIEKSAKQLQTTQIIQNAAANALAAKGLNDLQNMEYRILSPEIRQCYQLNKFTFVDALNIARVTAMQCITDKVNEGKTIIDNAINNIESAAQDIGNGAHAIVECKQFLTSFPSVAGAVAKVTCLSQAIITMKSAAILLPINLSQRIVEGTVAVSTIEADIIKCNLNILSAIITQATKAGQAIVNCMSQSANILN